MSDVITVVIADDHPLFRKGLRALLGTVPEVDVVGEATTGADAVMARGLSNGSIAAHLRLSPKTVRNYVSAVFAELHVGSRGEAIARAGDAGMS